MNSRASLFELKGRPSVSGSTSHNTVLATEESKQRRIQQRLAQKQQEYESLLQLKQHADSLLASMQQLETELGSLSQGTETVASVMANWANVFKAINMSTIGLQKQQEEQEAGEEQTESRTRHSDSEMPETLVRIPIQRE
ncbi:DASH complex subunit Dad2-domain-containing protein [Protomyces lactucae-debilis]|uniref:DASH complex subunit DAD2 n=1 Tax=Protomyces lactucae-debilis TaxID=2754530 RepID=A0A1Y2F7R8_PROLT|nr:DASH complex subunit Dad2-domain-containing protein [Protomyces lactucae-debilis]ORY79933.1 DASH complex subunit Dad2-domain-containing protein [Protomyces lactucae-debilis]